MPDSTSQALPLDGLRVLDFTHAVMGPSASMILADLGADVLHIEPPNGDSTRRLKGFGTGYFWFYNRNKKSLAVDIKSDEGREIIHRLVEISDVLVENFGPGTMDRLGYGYDDLKEINPQLIYCALKGFLSGPYEQRHAMDEVVQMMGGLAYMTGPPGRPLRAGTSVVDITGGMFGVIGILTALHERARTGEGRRVKSALFETTAFLVGQHMAYAAFQDEPIPPMPARVSAWSVYQTFDTADGEPVFIGIISEKHWKRFCEAFDREDLLEDERYQSNNDRIEHRDALIPDLEAMLEAMPKDEVVRRCEDAHIPFAPVARPEDLFDDPHLNAGSGLVETTFRDDVEAKVPRLPVEIDEYDFDLRNDPPRDVGADTASILGALGYDETTIQELRDAGVVTLPDAEDAPES
jgi:crotonobetainyl-CoA:carnitine CoA-transferase CaiB-like acyl-CoA transferase